MTKILDHMTIVKEQAVQLQLSFILPHVLILTKLTCPNRNMGAAPGCYPYS